MSEERIKIALLYGGRSSEHEISLISASSVISHLDREIFDILPIGIDREGRWWLNELAAIDPLAKQTLKVKAAKAQAIDSFSFLASQDNCVVFPVMHGTFSEDGAIQGLLELVNIPYVGAGVMSSAMCMDKDIAKRLLLEQNLPTVPYVSFNAGVWEHNEADITARVFENFGQQIFVKPANMGSSIGCSKVKGPDELAAAVALAFQYDNKILIEQAINAREIECAVLENFDYGEPPLVSVPGELVTQHEFYDYDGKYNDDTVKLVIPAELNETLTQKLQAMASEAFETLECQGMARVDFFLDKDNGDIYINELNTIPGFTPVSMYPMMWQASGLAYVDLLTALIELAVARYQRNTKLKRDIN